MISRKWLNIFLIYFFYVLFNSYSFLNVRAETSSNYENLNKTDDKQLILKNADLNSQISPFK